jgi:hypothetical protein
MFRFHHSHGDYVNDIKAISLQGSLCFPFRIIPPHRISQLRFCFIFRIFQVEINFQNVGYNKYWSYNFSHILYGCEGTGVSFNVSIPPNFPIYALLHALEHQSQLLYFIILILHRKDIYMIHFSNRISHWVPSRTRTGQRVIVKEDVSTGSSQGAAKQGIASIYLHICGLWQAFDELEDPEQTSENSHRRKAIWMWSL